jgi:hypothetical protein
MKRRGTPVTPGEKRRYDQLRDVGWSPEAAAESIHRSKSWAYNYEAEKRGDDKRKERQEFPSDDLSDAVDLVLAVHRDDEDAAFAIVDRFEASILPALCDLVLYFVRLRVGEEEWNLSGLLHDTPMGDELAAQPITVEEILSATPGLIRRVRRGEAARYGHMPARGEAWMAQLERDWQDNPEMKAFLDRINEATQAADPKRALAEMWREFEREHDEQSDEPDAVA